jgi:anti-sigma factor (TIGR02949 family)
MVLSKKSSYDCKEIEKYVQQYLDGVLEGENIKLFEEHLDYCLPCDKKIEFEKKLKDIVKIKIKHAVSKEKIDKRIDDMLKDLN